MAKDEAGLDVPICEIRRGADRGARVLEEYPGFEREARVIATNQLGVPKLDVEDYGSLQPSSISLRSQDTS